ncbi:MAG TPA: polyprenyl synthetase family protein, partial [Actinomycetota bacterium]
MSEAPQRPPLPDGGPGPALAGAVQRLALDSAHAVAERLGGVFRRFLDGAGTGGPGAGNPDEAYRRVEAVAGRAFDGCLRVLSSLDELATPWLARRLSRRAAPGPDAVVLPQAGAGGRCSARLWLHNTSPATERSLRPWTPGLHSDAGRMVPGHAIEFVPPSVERLDPGQSRELLVVGDVPSGTPPGFYHGQVLVEGLPGVALALMLEVVARPELASTGNGAEPGASLARYSRLVGEELRHYVGAPGAGGLAGADYLTQPLADYPSRAGKALRPSLCLATCEAFGGLLGDALPSATAIELLHNAFLVHDDIEDGSLMRRGDVTLHRRYGTPLALNAGDGLALLSVAALRENFDRLGPRMAERVMLEFDFTSRQTVTGQALELGWRRDNLVDLEPDDYLDLIMKKTCWYTTVLPLRVGALTGSRGSADLDAMVSFGLHLGAAFQIRDDVLNLVGDPQDYGKERWGDLVEGKRTLILIHLLAAADQRDRRWVHSYLARAPSERWPEDTMAL